MSLNIANTWLQKLNVSLSALDPFSNAQKETLLMYKQGGAASCLTGTRFYDGAPGLILPGQMGAQQAPFSGLWQPYRPLATLSDGVSRLAGLGGSSGVWRLSVTDWGEDVESRALVVDSWMLTLCEVSRDTPSICLCERDPILIATYFVVC